MTTWRKSSHSESTTVESDCVELAELINVVGIRDSKAPGSGHLAVSRADFGVLVAQVKRGSPES
ncbi:DUF397 domain-containing protein [Actinomadura kijaniata]|uniref:DUF397 domain-containing protein n=1 Tax=Actinomadura kijaniata TaxID=46161 RepID=UPI00082DE97D|nr:DUF397 domain-containing protein [Actinomadura kijaniata]